MYHYRHISIYHFCFACDVAFFIRLDMSGIFDDSVGLLLLNFTYISCLLSYLPLLSQAIMVSKELIRIAILWHEIWYDALEEASRQYFGARNVEGMFATLAPLHEMMDKVWRRQIFPQIFFSIFADCISDFCPMLYVCAFK